MDQDLCGPGTRPADRRTSITIIVDGQPIAAQAGEPVAVALWAAQHRILRRSADLRTPRGLFCAAGVCAECLMAVDGQPNVRTCLLPARAGMRVQTASGPEPVEAAP